ncbi:TetR/AcrR family transcriptional regulator [soil metagenome]
MNTKGERDRSTRQRLIDGTLDCVRRSGVDGATSREITTTAGVNLGAITYHFGSKDELVAEALLDAVRRWLDPVLAVLRSELEPAERTAAAVEALQRSLAEARSSLPTYLAALAHAPHSAPLRRGLDELLHELHELLAGQIEDMRSGGQLPPWVEPSAMAHLLVALADGIALHAVLQPDEGDLPAISTQALQLLLAVRQP